MAGDRRARGCSAPTCARVLERRGISVTAVDRGDLDLLDPVAVAEAVAAHDVVVNCAAWTAVDDAEDARGRGVRRSTPSAPALLARAARSTTPGSST